MINEFCETSKLRVSNVCNSQLRRNKILFGILWVLKLVYFELSMTFTIDVVTMVRVNFSVVGTCEK